MFETMLVPLDETSRTSRTSFVAFTLVISPAMETQNRSNILMRIKLSFFITVPHIFDFISRSIAISSLYIDSIVIVDRTKVYFNYKSNSW